MPGLDELNQFEQEIIADPLLRAAEKDYYRQQIAMQRKTLAPAAVNPQLPPGAVVTGGSIPIPGGGSTRYNIPTASEDGNLKKLQQYAQQRDLLSQGYSIPEMKTATPKGEVDATIVPVAIPTGNYKPAVAADILAGRVKDVDPIVLERIRTADILSKGGVEGLPAVHPYIANESGVNPFNSADLSINSYDLSSAIPVPQAYPQTRFDGVNVATPAFEGKKMPLTIDVAQEFLRKYNGDREKAMREAELAGFE